MNLENKLALVTGGSRGIGRAIALELARKGAHIAISYNSNEDKAREFLDEARSYGVKALAIRADVADKDQVQAMVEQVEKEFDAVDILVNNAGITRDNLLIRMSEEDWDQVMDTNLKGAFLTSKAVARRMMKKRYGKIINISSVVGIMGNPGQGNYSASKAGLIGFSKSLAKELAPRGIRVNAIAPGFIQTDMTDALAADVKEAMLEAIPLKSLGQPEDIARLVLFLASDYGDYITGQVINVDGGMNI